MKSWIKKILVAFWLLTCLGILFCQTPWNADFSRKYNYPVAETNPLPGEICRADSAHGFDVQKYEITLTVNDASHYIFGNVLATVTATENLTSMSYDLAGLSVSNVLVNGVHASAIDYGSYFTFPVSITAGEQFTTQVFYSGYPSLVYNYYNIGMIFNNNTVFTISDPDAARSWWPCYDHPWDKAIVDLHITMRSDWKVAANGIRTEIVNNGDGTSTTHWLGQNPMTTYLVCITAGPYVEINQTVPEQNNLPVQNFVLQNQYNNALIDLQNLPWMISWFSELFGDYPFEKYGNAVVSMSTYGAMEHQTMTTLGNYIITGTGNYEVVIAHELAHQWFGDAVSFLTFKDVWLSEGFATYSEFLWTDKRFGWQSACDYLQSNFHQYYLNWENNAGPQTIYNPSFNNYFSPPSYEKAASVLHMLRLKLGDTNFFNLLQLYYNTYKNENAVTAEFISLAEQVSGQDLSQFFNQWIFGSGIPNVEYSIWQNEVNNHLEIYAKTTSPTSTQFTVDIPFRITQNGVSDSLLVIANPDGFTNALNYTVLSNDINIVANYNHWTLLRDLSEQIPQISEYLSSNNCVLLFWNAFIPGKDNQYRLYRKLSSEQNWSLLVSLNNDFFSYADTTALSGVSYDYQLRVADINGNLSRPSQSISVTPQTFSFAGDLLVVDETRDGIGTSVNPNDEMVDTFYANALSAFSCTIDNWDYATQGIPDLATLGSYKLVLWHSDDFYQNLLQDNIPLISSYVAGGGKLVLSSWKTVSAFTPEFWNRFGGGVNPVYDNSPCLINAQSDVYPTLTVDPDKVLPSWNLMLPYIFTFSSAEEPLYTANMAEGSNGAGQCIAFRHDYNGTLVVFGFPLYYMQFDAVSSMFYQLLPTLNPALPLEEELVLIPQATLSAYPNPFNPTATISFSLPVSGKAELELFNLKGQKIVTLSEGLMSSGKHSICFNGCDENGRNLASGIYFLRLQHPAGIITKKITLLK
ncbi:MAG TPA: M1 family aminopeptidase [Candidatus Cloacimonas sp.]|nr:M1 family aminopeptidase [Candidatus Cloacimonas sp.]